MAKTAMAKTIQKTPYQEISLLGSFDSYDISGTLEARKLRKLDQLRDWWNDSDYRIEVVDYYFNRTRIAPIIFIIFYCGTIILILFESFLLFSNLWGEGIGELISIFITAGGLVILLILQRGVDNLLIDVLSSQPVPVELQIEAIDRFFSGLSEEKKETSELTGAKYLMKEVWDDIEDKESEPAQKLWRAMAALDAYSLRMAGKLLDEKHEEEE